MPTLIRVSRPSTRAERVDTNMTASATMPAANAAAPVKKNSNFQAIVKRLFQNRGAVIGLAATAFGAVVGCAIGAITGYFGGTLDTVLMRFLDILEAIPGLLLTICVSAVLGSGFDKTILALAITSIPQYVRLLRAQVFSVRDEEYLEAAESISCSKFRIITRYVLPNSLSPVIVKATMSVAQTILTAASLSYVGLGVQPPTPEWGAMLSAGRAYIRSYPHLIMFPGIFIMITVLGLNLFGDGLRDALDPKLKK